MLHSPNNIRLWVGNGVCVHQNNVYGMVCVTLSVGQQIMFYFQPSSNIIIQVTS